MGEKLRYKKFLKYIFSSNRVCVLYLSIILVGLVSFFSYAVFHGDAYYRFTVYGLSTDSYMDFFNSCRDAAQGIGCYTERHVIYPPLANLFYVVMGQMLTKEYVNTDFDDRMLNEQGLCNIFPFLFFTMIVVSMLAILVFHRVKGSGIKKLLVALSFITCWPFCFMIERGNILLVAYFFLLIFVFYHDSDNKIYREIALICLAISAGIKLYPAVFGLILLCKKRYKEVARTVLYGILSVILPSFYYSGLSVIPIWINNLIRFSLNGNSDLSFVGSTSISSVIYVCKQILETSIWGYSPMPGWLSMCINLFSMLIVAVAVFVLPKYWQKLMALVLLAIIFPGSGGSYSMILLSIPLIYMMEDKDIKIYHYIYVFIIAATHALYPFPLVMDSMFVSVNYALLSFVILLLFVIIFAEVVYEIIRIIKNKRKGIVKV